MSKNKLPISKSRYYLIPALEDIFAKKSFSGHKIDQIIRENQIEGADKALFTELLYGYLRFGHQLNALAEKFFSDPKKIPEKVYWILGTAFYQKLYLSRIPDHAIVNESVEMTKRYMGHKGPFSGLVNAVLKKFITNVEKFKNLDKETLALQMSYPQELADYLITMWGEMKFFQLAKAMNTPAKTFIRVNTHKISEEKLLLKLKSQGLNVLQTGLPNCLEIPDLALSPKDIAGYNEGLWSIQNMGSQRIVRFLDVQAGELVLDACAGYGGKTLQMAEMSQDKATIHFHDIIDKKMHATELRAKSMGFKQVKPVVKLEAQYDKILVDAPCSGLGTIASHPEIKWFRSSSDILEQTQKQLQVLTTYATLLKSGGKILYAICSIDQNEGDGVVQKFLDSHPEFEKDASLETPFFKGSYGYYFLPTEKGESGYYFARLVKKG